MANVSQIEVNGTTYTIRDAVLREKLSDASDWFICDGEPSYGQDTGTLDNPASSISSEHARLYTEAYFGSPCFATRIDNSDISYVFNIWGDTGNLRLDSYNHNTEERKILGYVPLSDHATNQGVQKISGTSLITPASGWSVNSCTIHRWGQIVQIYIVMGNTVEFTIDKIHGNITNVAIGTLNDSTYYPTNFSAMLFGSNGAFNQAWGYLGTAGAISIGAFGGTGVTQTIDAGKTLYLHGRYILRMDTSQF